MRTTRTYAILEVPPEIYAWIREKLADAGYEHAFHDHSIDGEVIDMNGLALRAISSTPVLAVVEVPK